MSSTEVSRARLIESLGVLHIYKLYESDQKLIREYDKREDFIKQWIGHAALGPGAVQYRMLQAERYNNFENPEIYPNLMVKDYAVSGRTDTIMYSTPQSLIKSNTFRLLEELGKNKNLQTGEAQQLMANATTRMIKVLFKKIDDLMIDQIPSDPKAQEEIQKKLEFFADPSIQELIQITLTQIAQHMATATHRSDDFRVFIQAIDLIHSELATFLHLFQPFNPIDFESAMMAYLSETVSESKLVTSIGLARSAMNIFAGINNAIIRKNPEAVRICGDHSYYEESDFVDSNLSLNNALDDLNIKKIDLYVAEFNHNINIDPKHTAYEKANVIEDIQNIFEKKPDTDRLTVAIDATIDFTNSEDLKKLINKFRPEIDSGKLNLVIFKSGQKFDMLGLDNYFGAPFYIINNGDDKWADFKKIKTDQAFQTDQLSSQFFTWMALSGLDLVDSYKELIFKNTRAILDLVPSSLLPSNSELMSISTFNRDVKSPFIEIRIDLSDQMEYVSDTPLHVLVSERFVELFIKEKKLVYLRGSFGFPNPNITWIAPKMRINPGIDPSDVPVFEKFFKELERLVTGNRSKHNPSYFS